MSNQYFPETTHHLTVPVDRPGSTKDLFAVFLDGQHAMNVGPRNSYGLKPGMDMSVRVLRNDLGSILSIQPV